MRQKIPLTPIARIGVAGMIISLVFWVLLLGVPFLPLNGNGKATATLVVICIAEVLFWGGAVMAGKELTKRVRAKLNPANWRKKDVPPPE